MTENQTTVDFGEPLPELYTGCEEVIMKGSIEEVTKTYDRRVYVIKEPHRTYKASIYIWYDGDDFPDHWDREEMEDGVMILRHGCHFWMGERAFYDAFDHALVGNYDSDGDERVIRQMYRHLQEIAVRNGWVKKRASNSIATMQY